MTGASPNRARIVATRHMVAAGHHLAAQAGLQVLVAGGNAIDAGCAAGIALGVLQSEYVGFGGVAPIMVHIAGTGETHTVSGLGWWPRAARAAWFRERHGGRIPAGIHRTVIPAAPDAWITALARWGTMGWADVASAALRFADEGFAMTVLSARLIAENADGYRRWPQNAAIWLPGGRAPLPGEIFRNAELAATIRFMADEERAAIGRGGDRQAGLAAARDAFYRGDIAARMAAFHRDEGGWVTREDLAAFRSAIAPATLTRFRELEVLSCGPWCQGPALPQMLNLLDGIDLAALGHNSPAYLHVLVEAMKLCFADRHVWIADPDFVRVPLAGLLSPDYAARRRRLIDPERAHPGMPEAGTAAELGADHQPGAALVPHHGPYRDEALDTSYACVVDRWGNAVSATPSDGSFSGPAVPGLGFVPSSRGAQSWTDPSHPAVLAPGKRPRLTPNPAMLRRPDGSWIMPFGSPGNDVQAQAMLQVVLNHVVWDMPPQDATEAPRVATVSYPRSSEPHDYHPGRINLERRFDDATAEALAAKGHVPGWWEGWDYRAGAVCLVSADRQRGIMEGGADPRRPTGIAAL